MIDEASRRRPEFSGDSVPITLADAKQWWFPKPWLEVRSTFVNGKPYGLWTATTHGRDFDIAVDALSEAEQNSDIILGIMTIGAHLLRKNYDLADDELEQLFVFRFDTPETTEASMAMVREIANVATGRTGFFDYARWMSLSLRANGITGPILLEDAIDICQILEETGRTIKSHLWVADLVQKALDGVNDGVF